MSDDHMASLDHARATGSALVDLSKIRPGDEVLVRRTVTSLSSGQVNIGGENTNTLLGVRPLWVSADQIIDHTPTALAVGDTARHPEYAGRFRIVAIDGSTAWCKWDDGCRHDVPLSGMVRVDD